MRLSRALVGAAIAIAAVAAAIAGGAGVSEPQRAESVLFRAPTATTRPATPARWCGSAPSAQDRLPEAVAGAQVHVVYAFPSDATDATAARAAAIVTDLTAGDGWWRGQDPARTPRFDLFAFPGCDSELGQLDLSSVRLPQNAAAYAIDSGAVIDRLATDLALDSSKKHLVYYDGPVDDDRVCGISYSQPQTTGRFGVAIVFLGSRCGADLGQGRLAADTAIHELTHDLGAVPGSAPNTCAQSRGHVCDSPADLMYPFVQALSQATLDVNRDDYYGHAGAWWDVQDSPFLRHLDAAQVPLSVAIEGGGTVSSTPPGIDCPSGCAIGWDPGSVVTLVPAAVGAARFVGWGGACSGAGSCIVTMDAAKSVTARFVSTVALRLVVALRGGASGAVRSSTGDRCTATCVLDVDPGTAVSLDPLPGRGARFVGWSGSCSGRGSCRIEPSADTSVVAVFGPSTFAVSAAVTGRGRVLSTPGGVSCPSRCSGRFAADATVRLRALPAAGWRFSRWTGDCRGRARCAVKADRAHAVRATFVRG